MYFVITYKEYCEAMGETYDGTTPAWFYRIQDLAINTIRSEIVDVKIFPKNSGMLHQLKKKWMPAVIQGIARQIYYTYNNEYFLLNGVFANRSYNQTQYGEGPVDKAAYDVAVSHACKPCQNAFIETGWFCKRMDVKFDKDKYYVKYDPSIKDINWGQIGGNVIDQLDLLEYLSENYTAFDDYYSFKTTTNQSLNLIDTNIEALTLALDSKQDKLNGLASYGTDKILTTSDTGEIVWSPKIKLSALGTSTAKANFITDTDGKEWQLAGSGSGGSWGEIFGNIFEQEDLVENFQYKVYYGETQPTTPKDNDIWVYQNEDTPIDYNDLTHKPSINSVTLQNDISLSALNLYSQEEVDERIGTLSATYRGAYEAGTTPAVGFDYDTFIKAQPEIQAITPNNNDYCYVIWSEDNFYDQCAYVSATGKWDFRIRIKGDATVKYVELYGAKGEVTQEQLNILKASPSNYIWLGESTASDDGLILHCIYYNPENSATYECVKNDTNYTLTLDLSSKEYTVVTTQFAKKDEIITPVQSDWSQTDDTQLDYIKNKPTLSDLVIIQEYKIQDITLAALGSVNINFTPPTVSGYTYITSLNPTVFGGSILAQLNRVGTTGHNIWLFNQNNFIQKGEVWLQSLYVRNN